MKEKKFEGVDTKFEEEREEEGKKNDRRCEIRGTFGLRQGC